MKAGLMVEVRFDAKVLRLAVEKVEWKFAKWSGSKL